jgi:hypothetical protein
MNSFNSSQLIDDYISFDYIKGKTSLLVYGANQIINNKQFTNNTHIMQYGSNMLHMDNTTNIYKDYSPNVIDKYTVSYDYIIVGRNKNNNYYNIHNDFFTKFYNYKQFKQVIEDFVNKENFLILSNNSIFILQIPHS